MKISGFTIIKNAVINDYPIVEAITSILPVVDEMIVLAGDSDDNTVELIELTQLYCRLNLLQAQSFRLRRTI